MPGLLQSQVVRVGLHLNFSHLSSSVSDFFVIVS